MGNIKEQIAKAEERKIRMHRSGVCALGGLLQRALSALWTADGGKGGLSSKVCKFLGV